MSAKASGSFSGTGNGNAAVVDRGPITGDITGVFVGTVVLEKSRDNGSTWTQAYFPNTATAISFTAPAAIEMENIEQAQYRWRCSAYTSGTVTHRIGQ